MNNQEDWKYFNELMADVPAAKLTFIKRLAKALSGLKDMKLSEAYETLSHEAGFKDWNTACAKIKEADSFFFGDMVIRVELETIDRLKMGKEHRIFPQTLAAAREYLRTRTPADEIELTFYTAFKNAVEGLPAYFELHPCASGMHTHPADRSQLMVDYNALTVDYGEEDLKDLDRDRTLGLFTIVGERDKEIQQIAASVAYQYINEHGEIWLSSDLDFVFEKITNSDLIWFQAKADLPFYSVEQIFENLKRDLRLPRVTYEEELAKVQPHLRKFINNGGYYRGSRQI